MRAITNITIRVEGKTVTMFLTYNGDANDYSFNNYKSVEDAINSVKSINDPYFPIKTNSYRLLKIKGNKTLSDETKTL